MWQWVKYLHFSTVIAATILSGFAVDLYAFEPDDRWALTATNGSTGSWGTPITLTWGLVDDGTIISGSEGASGSDLVNFLDTEFSAGNWMSIFDDAFGRLAELSGLTYVHEPNNTSDPIDNTTTPRGLLGVRPDLRIGGHSIDGQAGSNTLAYNYFPDHGDLVIDTDNITFYTNESNNYRAFRNTIMHETLHGVGLGHVDLASPGFLLEPQISTDFDGPQLDDLLGMQRLYGDVYEKNGGNDQVATATSLGVVSSTQTATIGQHGDSALILDSQTDFISIDDNSDADFFSFTLNSAEDIAIQLRPQGIAYEVGPQDGTVATLDVRELSDLTLSLYDTNGVSVLGTSNTTGLGGIETLVMSLNAGTYFARVSGAHNNIQLYELRVAVGVPENLIWTGQTSSVWNLQGTANFDNGSGPDVFANLDTVTFDDSGQEKVVSLAGSLSPEATIIDAAADYTLQGTGALTGGSLTKNGTGTLELATSGNSYAEATQVNAGTLILSGDTSAMVSTITVAGGATLVMDSSPAGVNGSSFVIDPGGTMQVGTATSNADVFPNNPVILLNHGEIRVVDFESVTNISGTGDVIAEAELALLANNSFTGQAIVEAGGAIQPTDNTAFGSNVGNTIVEAGGYVVARNDAFGPATLVLSESFVLAGNGDGNGALQITDSTNATFQGDWAMATGGAMVGVSGGSSLAMSGTLNAVDGLATLYVASGSTLELSGSLQLGVAGLAKTSLGPAIMSGAVSLNGPLDIQGGSLQMTGSGSSIHSSVRVASGALLQTTSNPTWSATSGLTGNGTVEGNLTMPGTIEPGDATVGSLFLDGNLTLADSTDWILELGGVLAGEFDTLDVDGQAVLDGTLTVELVDLGAGVFQPQLGDTFGFLDAQLGTSGFFDGLALPSLASGLAWQLSLQGTTTHLSVVNSFTADFDQDGDVDGTDLLQWAGDFGVPGSDANGDGLSSGLDYLVWQQQFGSGVLVGAGAAVVPEPTTLVLLLSALLGWNVKRRGERKKVPGDL
ncbi:MAG TPA: hypothetical protein DHW22_08970 [Planctomycetaceae bacterium]|nr:hypothetical protein [Planctomycetaceae bacterium]